MEYCILLLTLLKYWVDFNHCDSVPTTTAITNSDTTDNCTVEHHVYAEGDQGVTVELYKVMNGGHAWPAIGTTGGLNSPTLGVAVTSGNRNGDFNASLALWNFFRKKSLTTVGINEEENSENEVSVFPNPSNGTFTLSVENFQNSIVQISNSLGENVYESTLTNASSQIDLKTLPAGIYFYKVVNTTIINTGKIIIK